MTDYTVAALYHFTKFTNPAALREPLLKQCKLHRAKGTLLLAREGINGTIAAPRAGIDAILAYIRTMPSCANLQHKESHASQMPFLRMKVRLKAEIVTMGQPDIDPTLNVGNYVAPKNWNDLIERDDVVTIDTRNDYEVGIGTFKGAVNPQTASFGEFPAWWQKNKHKYHNKKIAMFCTGGIRCEKSTNYLLNNGVKDVYHLEGGILKYLEDVPEAQSTWHGECFVFDGRVAVKHALKQGSYSLCYACRMPLTLDDLTRPEFEKGVSCHLCIEQTDDTRKDSFRERQKQVELAAKRGKHHLG